MITAKRFFPPFIGIVASGLGGYYAGRQSISSELKEEAAWKTMDSGYFKTIFPHALKYGPWQNLSKEIARETLVGHLDASLVPHGDLAIPSKNVHSGRYTISIWQRVATGAGVIVLGRDQNQDLCVALGQQEKEIGQGQKEIRMVHAQGYMEAHLPKDDMTGLRAKGASRINGKTGELIQADDSLEDTAVREVKEELGLNITKDKLKFIGMTSAKDANPIVHSVNALYATELVDTPKLETLDTEFPSGDLSHPDFYKIKDIEIKNGFWYVKGSKYPIHEETVVYLIKALNVFASESDKVNFPLFLKFKSK